jgi:hypothetical protein
VKIKEERGKGVRGTREKGKYPGFRDECLFFVDRKQAFAASMVYLVAVSSGHSGVGAAAGAREGLKRTRGNCRPPSCSYPFLVPATAP